MGLIRNILMLQDKTLLMDPLPKINKLFALVLQEEQLLGISYSSQFSKF